MFLAQELSLKRHMTIWLAGTAIVAALALGGCGRKGPLEPHPDDTSAAPRQRSAITTPEPLEQRARPQRRTLSSPVTPSKEPFILDPLL